MTKLPYITGQVFTDRDKCRRIATGIRRTTLGIPGGKFTRIGPNYDWKRQAYNYECIHRALARHGLRLTRVASNTYAGHPSYQSSDRWNKTIQLTSFVAICYGVLVWEKYEGWVAGGGQNRIYIGGQQIKTTSFLEMTKLQEDELIESAIAG